MSVYDACNPAPEIILVDPRTVPRDSLELPRFQERVQLKQ